jgi:UDPglucose 6-dehydrogenase
MKPDRIVIGGNSDRAIALMQKVYEPFAAPVLVTDINSAELIKHAANSFLALKISYANALSEICEASRSRRHQSRRRHRQPTNASAVNSSMPASATAAPASRKTSPPSLPSPTSSARHSPSSKEVQRINHRQLNRFLDGIREALWVLKDKKLAVWGLAFKPNTDDVRSSVAITSSRPSWPKVPNRHRL